MRNKYPGVCYRCGELVKKGEGHFERHKGRWRVQHAECAIIYREIGRNRKKEVKQVDEKRQKANQTGKGSHQEIQSQSQQLVGVKAKRWNVDVGPQIYEFRKTDSK